MQTARRSLWPLTLLAADAEGIAKQGFVFAKPEETEGRQVTNLNFEEGCIKCKVRQPDRQKAIQGQRQPVIAGCWS